MRDPFNAFCPHGVFTLPGAPAGPLAGLTFAAKDNFDVVGHVTGAGSPDWLRTHAPAARTAPAVQAPLDAGASLIGKTRMDELAFSLDGRNAHYGTPVNPAAPARIPGGSSSGSAAATAGRLVDFALGTDTAGSVRVPAHNCGLYGFRPTHGRIPLEGVAPFSPSFDTVGWFARDASLLRRVGQVLLPSASPPAGHGRLLVADDLFALADAEVREALVPLVGVVAEAVGPVQHVTLCPDGPAPWVETFGTLRGAEVRESLGEWIDRVQPAFAPGIRERFEQTRSIPAESVAAARSARRDLQRQLDEMLSGGNVLCFPTAPLLAPLRDSCEEVFTTYRSRALQLTCFAPVGGVPQVSLPLASRDGCPAGMSLLGGRGEDARLWERAVAIEDGIRRE